MDGLVQQQPEALRELYQRYGKILRAVAVRVLHDESDAEDVLQETLCQVWCRAECYRAEKGRPIGWLITLARRRAIDRLRQRSAYRKATERFEIELKHPGRGAEFNHPVEREAFRDELRELLRRLISRLPPAQQQVVVMAFFQGLSQREIAHIANLPLGTVKTRLELGLRKLANVLTASRAKIG